MRWMNWGWDDLASCPLSVYLRIVQLMQEEINRREQEETAKNLK